MQGCPLSALFFNFARDPLLRLFDRLVVSEAIGKVWACADDLAATVRHLEQLKPVANAFRHFATFSGLHLSPTICVIVLNGVAATEKNVQLVKSWLAEYIHDWSHFAIDNSAKYLGILMAPLAGRLQWHDAIAKFGCDYPVATSSSSSPLGTTADYFMSGVPRSCWW